MCYNKSKEGFLMSNGTVGNNSDGMRNWSSNIEGNADDYDRLVNNLYSLVESFANSRDFKGTLSDTFYNSFIAMKPEFLKYSATFRDCAELIRRNAANIDNNRSYLNNKINSQNYFNYYIHHNWCIFYKQNIKSLL